MKHKNKRRWSISNKVFLDNFWIAVLMELSAVLSALIDGMLTSRMLSADAMAAFGIAHPLYSIMGIFVGLFSAGMLTVTSQELGRGNVRECNRFFSAAFYISALFSFVLTGGVMLFGDQLASLLGASGDNAFLRPDAAGFLRGLASGAPAFFLSILLEPMVQMDNGRKRVLVAVNVKAVIDVVADIIVIRLGMGLFGVGLASAIAQYVELIILLLHFTKKERLLRLSALKTSFSEFIHMLSFGTEKALRRFGNVLRPVLINRLILFYGGAAAMTAMSIRNNVTNFTEVFTVGIADALGLLAGIYYGEKNAEAMTNLGKNAHRSCAVFCGGTSVLLLILAKPIAGYYTHNDASLLPLVIFALVGAAIQGPMQALVRARICYLQRIQKNRNMRMLLITSSFILPILSALILGYFFGVYGVLLCYTAGDLLSLIVVWLYYAFSARSLIPKTEAYMALPPEFHIPPGDIISLDIRDMDDVMIVSEQIALFCKGHKISKKVTNHAAVCFEEMAVNTVKYGFPQNKAKDPIIDLRVVLTKKRLVMRLQDNCPRYDVSVRIASLEHIENGEQIESLGTWVTKKLADEIRYVYTFETNTLFLEFNLT